MASGLLRHSVSGRQVELLALPDFAAERWRIWGASRSRTLLVDPVNATHFERQLVADVVAHELAHMWFETLSPCAGGTASGSTSLCNVHGNCCVQRL